VAVFAVAAVVCWFGGELQLARCGLGIAVWACTWAYSWQWTAPQPLANTSFQHSSSIRHTSRARGWKLAVHASQRETGCNLRRHCLVPRLQVATSQGDS
jgi:hypothetical protein